MTPTNDNLLETLSSENKKEFFSRVSKATQKIKAQKFCCYPNCNTGASVIDAHLLKKQGTLSPISDNGSVYWTRISQEEVLKSNGKPRPFLCPISKVSTFKGFCSEHDNQIFELIDQNDFVLDPQHLFLYMYRVISSGIWWSVARLAREAAMAGGEKKLARRRAKNINFVANQLELMQIEVHRGVMYKKKLDLIKENNEFSRIRGVSFEIIGDVGYAASVDVAPTCDWNGNPMSISMINHPAIPSVSITVHPNQSGKGGQVSFSWLDTTEEYIHPFVHSFCALSPKSKGKKLMQYFFHNYGSTAISPKFWDSLNVESQNFLLRTWWGQHEGYQRTDREAILDTEPEIETFELKDPLWLDNHSLS